MRDSYVMFKNEHECIIRFKNSRQSQDFLNLIIQDCKFFFIYFKIQSHCLRVIIFKHMTTEYIACKQEIQSNLP